MIPLLKYDEVVTHNYVTKLSDAIKSDGCTDIPEFHHDCCVIHDLGYRYGIDSWGRLISRDEIDANFRKCMQADSIFGRFDPMSWWRWAGVRIFGRFFYSPNKA